MYISLYISQKSSGNGKDLLQIHVPTAWVSRSHTLYVGIIHVLLHRLVRGVGNQFSCLLGQLGDKGGHLQLHYRHAFNGD